MWGLRNWRWSRQAAPAVHPHACGDYVALFVLGLLLGRFIPTRVGTTFSLRLTATTFTVHPHACGDYVPQVARLYPVNGSSPRVWGLRCDETGSTDPHRFIPTRVGTTLRLGAVVSCDSVHPHACGDYEIAERFGQFQDGSSPRVWGLPPS